MSQTEQQEEEKNKKTNEASESFSINENEDKNKDKDKAADDNISWDDAFKEEAESGSGKNDNKDKEIGSADNGKDTAELRAMFLKKKELRLF